MELVNEMFESLISDSDINWIKVGFYPSTESIIYNNVDKYSRFQSIHIQEMVTGDMMVVFKRKLIITNQILFQKNLYCNVNP